LPQCSSTLLSAARRKPGKAVTLSIFRNKLGIPQKGGFPQEVENLRRLDNLQRGLMQQVRAVG
jgi:hypothetical protein